MLAKFQHHQPGEIHKMTAGYWIVIILIEMLFN